MKLIFSGDLTIPSEVRKGKVLLCNINIVQYDNGRYCAIFAGKGKGLSATNLCDRVSSLIYSKYLSKVNPADIVWLEYYAGSKTNNATVDIVEFSQHEDTQGDTVFLYPTWKRLYETNKIDPQRFLSRFSEILKELSSPVVLLSLEDKRGYLWRLWANRNGLFVITSNPRAKLPLSLMDASLVRESLEKNLRFFKEHTNIEEMLTESIIKGFLYKGL